MRLTPPPQWSSMLFYLTVPELQNVSLSFIIFLGISKAFWLLCLQKCVYFRPWWRSQLTFIFWTIVWVGIRDRNHQPTYFLESGCFWSSFFFPVPRPTWSATYIGPSEACSPDGCQSQGKGALSAGEAVIWMTSPWLDVVGWCLNGCCHIVLGFWTILVYCHAHYPTITNLPAAVCSSRCLTMKRIPCGSFK